MMQKSKNYVLGMFPYPSGAGLHVGHVRIYTAVDVMARYFRMRGDEVLCPTGWDAFGLPAENAAIKNKTVPQKIVPQNYNNFRAQMKNLDFAFDWERELATTDPNYYGLTQWLFLKLYEKGLVYQEQVPINWCPKCKTGLANEEVLPDGTHERCGEKTTKKELPQWVMRITDYAERLLEPVVDVLGSPDLSRSNLDWPRGILEMQKNWIGKKEGVEIEYRVVNGEWSENKTVTVFTTRIDTIYGVSFVVIAPELAKEWMQSGWQASDEVKEYVELSLAKSEQVRLAGVKEKTGVKSGLKAVNPMNDDEVPIYVADYVLASVGTGAVMGVPAHDERDWEFAKKYGLEVKVVVSPDGTVDLSDVFTGEGRLVNSGKYTGMESGEASEVMLSDLNKLGVAKKRVSWHLRDWVFSRQRYWGEPIPLVHCDKCGVVPLAEKDLPLELPRLEEYEPTDTGESPLSRVSEWVETTCPRCGGQARRETDTMPNWAGSCWYFLAFPFWTDDMADVLKEYKKKYPEKPYTKFWDEVAKPAIDKWMPVDWYLGGAEHAVLHLLYARFWMKVFKDMNLVRDEEPFKRLRSVGIVLAEDGRKMSKSWGNVVNPDDVVKEFGSDAVRLYEMFMGPWDQSIAWDTRALVGMKRFVERVEKTVKEYAGKGETDAELNYELAKLIKKVEQGILKQKFNTSIAGMMELVNKWREVAKQQGPTLSFEEVRKLAQIMSPFAPKLAQRMWEMAKGEGKVEEAGWPSMEVEEIEVPVTLAVQVNGKLRSTVSLTRVEAQDKDRVMELVKQDEKVMKWVEGKEIKKTIFVAGKLVNLVV